MFTRIHPKNVHEMSSKKCPRKVTQKEDISWTFLSTKCRQKCPRDVTPFVHEMSPIMSTKCLPPKKLHSKSKYKNDEFLFSSGWLEGFKKRYNIKFKTIVGEIKSAD